MERRRDHAFNRCSIWLFFFFILTHFLAAVVCLLLAGVCHKDYFPKSSPSNFTFKSCSEHHYLFHGCYLLVKHLSLNRETSNMNMLSLVARTCSDIIKIVQKNNCWKATAKVYIKSRNGKFFQSFNWYRFRHTSLMRMGSSIFRLKTKTYKYFNHRCFIYLSLVIAPLNLALVLFSIREYLWKLQYWAKFYQWSSIIPV